MTSTLAGSHPN